MVGSTVNSYRIKRVLGQSRTDELVVATAAAADGSEVPVLLQILRVPLGYETFARDLRWTRRAIRELQHPNIVGIEGVEQLESPPMAGEAPEQDEHLLLRLRYTEGETLQRRLQQMRESGELFTEDDALALVAQLARALAPALRKGMVHRTLYPHHIVVRPEGTPALLGLDMPVTLANALIAAGDEAQLAYLSPEQRQGLMLDARSNIYSLGALLYDMLHGGAVSTQAREASAPAIRQVAGLRAARPDLSAATYRLVEKALQPESWARYQTYDELLGAMGVATLPAAAGARVAASRKAVSDRRKARAGGVLAAAPAGARRLALVGALALFLIIAGLVWAGQGFPAGLDPDARQMAEGEGDGPLTAPLRPPRRESPSPVATTEPAENIAAGVSPTPTLLPTDQATVASPSPQPTATSGVNQAPSPSATPPSPQPTATPLPTATDELPPPPPPQPTATDEPPPPPTATDEPPPTATDEPPPPPPPPPTATPPPPPTAPAPTATPPPPVPPSPTSETAPQPTPTATSPLANGIR